MHLCFLYFKKYFINILTSLSGRITECELREKNIFRMFIKSKSLKNVPADPVLSTPLQSDQWISLPPMPTPRAGAAVAVLGKQILVVGGVGEDQSPLKVVEMYNTEEGRWRRRSALREALMGVSITVKGTSCYIITNNFC